MEGKTWKVDLLKHDIFFFDTISYNSWSGSSKVNATTSIIRVGLGVVGLGARRINGARSASKIVFSSSMATMYLLVD